MRPRRTRLNSQSCLAVCWLSSEPRQADWVAPCPQAYPVHRQHNAAPTRVGTVRRDSGPIPLLPAGMGSLRSVSVILTSPPQQAKRARSGSLQLHSAQCEGGGDQSVITGGNPEPPPAPENHGPGSMFPPDPLPASPHCGGSRRTHDRGMCKQTSAHGRGMCTGRRAPRGRHTYRYLPVTVEGAGPRVLAVQGPGESATRPVPLTVDDVQVDVATLASAKTVRIQTDEM